MRTEVGGARPVHSSAVGEGQHGEAGSPADPAGVGANDSQPSALQEAELAVRQRQCTIELLRGELAAMEADLRALDRHVGHLEHGRLVMEIEMGQLRQRAAELFSDLERDEATIAALRAELELRRRTAGQQNAAGQPPLRRDLWRTLRDRLTSTPGRRARGAPRGER